MSEHSKAHERAIAQRLDSCVAGGGHVWVKKEIPCPRGIAGCRVYHFRWQCAKCEAPKPPDDGPTVRASRRSGGTDAA